MLESKATTEDRAERAASYAARGRSGQRDLPCSPLEWHLCRSRWLAFLIDTIIHLPRRAFYIRKWKQRQSARSLSKYESRRFSQYGEDGIIAEIFARIGERNKFFVEFGIGDGSECCTRDLTVNRGWKGVLIEGSEADVAAARQLYADFPNVNVVCSFITAENILNLFKDHDVPHEPDLLVIDIDGNDYWVWDRILSAYRPRVVVIEYNARWAPPVEWIMPYDPDHVWSRCAYFGASLASLAKLGARHGFSLIGCTSTGVNAFFVRNDELGDRFVGQSCDAGFHYAPPLYTRGYGHSIHSRIVDRRALVAPLLTR